MVAGVLFTNKRNPLLTMAISRVVKTRVHLIKFRYKSPRVRFVKGQICRVKNPILHGLS